MKMWSSSRLRKIVAAIAAAAALILAVGASAAGAAPVAIPGNPLTVYVGEQGQLQGFLSGSSEGIYFAPDLQLGDAGFFLAFPTGGKAPVGHAGHVWGFEGAAGPEELEEFEPKPGGQHPVTGSGTAAEPFSQVTEYGAEGVNVIQTTTSVNGATQFQEKWTVVNASGVPTNFRAFAAADFYFEGDDRGTGIFTAGPPRFIGGTNVDSGRSGGFVEVNDGISPPWSHYQELPFPDIWKNVIQQAANPLVTFNDTVDPEDTDNAGGVEWDQFQTTTLEPGKSATFELIGRIAVPSALQMSPTNAGAPQGVPIQISATALDSVGTPYAGRTLHYTTTGANPGSGALTLDGSGKAVITDPGTHAGGDTIAAFVDFNNNGVRDANEPQASALATFVDSIPPSCTVSVKGDRPGGKGGAGKALVVTVNCGEAATVTLSGTLTLPPLPVKGAKGAHGHARVSKGKKKRKTVVRLPVTSATVAAGAATPISVKLPAKIAHKYAGKTISANVVATVRDSAGNTSTARSTAKVKVAAAKKKGKGQGHH